MARARHEVPAEGRPAARLTRPVREFLATEISGGLVLLSAVVVALAWANSPWSGTYADLWGIEAGFSVGGFEVREDLRNWVNDGLMVLFFFVIGLEVKRELVAGELNRPRKASLPAFAALGGMVVPAGVYLAINAGGEGARGWGIPVATDIAFAVGILALIGDRVPKSLRVFLLTLAIVDDIGAILVIAFFYSSSLEWPALAAAGGLLGVVVGMRALHVWWVPAYALVGAGVWMATLESGVHATIAGVALGLLTPARPLSRRALRHAPLPRAPERGKDEVRADRARTARVDVEAAVPVTERLAHILHPWTSYAILPLFALANAGIAIGSGDLSRAAGSPITLGIIAGLVAGKTVGIAASSLAAERVGASLPRGVRPRHVFGMGSLAGIGFTMSLFIGNLAFEDQRMIEEAKLGILAGSVVAATLGVAILAFRGLPLRRS